MRGTKPAPVNTAHSESLSCRVPLRRLCQAAIPLLALLTLFAFGASSASADAIYQGDDQISGVYTIDFNVGNGGWTNVGAVYAGLSGLDYAYWACDTSGEAAENDAAADWVNGGQGYSGYTTGSAGATIPLSPGVNYPSCAVIPLTAAGIGAVNETNPNNLQGYGYDFYNLGGLAIGYDPTSAAQLTPSLDVASNQWYGSAPTLDATATTGVSADPVYLYCTITDNATGQSTAFSANTAGSATASGGDPYTGSQTLSCDADNATGTTSPWASVTFGVDSAPSLSISGTTSGQWYATAQTITVNATASEPGLENITCTDNGSTLNATSSSINGSDGIATFSVGQNGVNTVSCSATDNDNLVGTSSTTVDIDTTLPSVTFSGATFNQWLGSSQTVTATATAGPSGVYSLKCGPTGSPPTTFVGDTGTVAVDGTGTHTVSCIVENNAQVQETVTSDPIEIDEQDPTVSFSGVNGLTGAVNSTPANPEWIAAGGTLTITGAEPIQASGIKSVSCQVNGGGYATADSTSYSLPITGSGQYEIDCYATSNTGFAGSPTAYYVDINTATTSDGQSNLINSGQSAFVNGPSQTQWYRDAQTITVDASLPDGDQITTVDCEGAGVHDDDTNLQHGASENISVNVGAPGGTLTCTATDQYGNVYALGSYQFNIDNTAPTGYFVGEDPDSPALIRAAVADSGSGVANVVINAMCKSGACATAIQNNQQPAVSPLPTTYNAADGYWEATIPDDGSLADGTYTLVAETSDVAGNSGEVTDFADGDQAGISLPARVVTDLDATVIAGADEATSTTVTDTDVPTQTADAAHASHTTGATAKNTVCTVKTVTLKKATKTSAAKTKLKKVCVKIKKVKALTLKYGQKSTISGLLVDQVSDTPIAGASVQIDELITGQTSPTLLKTVKTNRLGEWKATLKAGPNRVIEAVYDGTPVLRSSGAKVSEDVKGTSTLTGPTQLVAGHTATLSGKVKGGYIPPGGVQVQLWYTIKGSHVAFAPWTTTIHTNSKGKWKFTFNLASYTAGSTYEFEVKLDKQYGWGFLSGKSKILTRKIR